MPAKMKGESKFLKAPGLADFFYLTKYANLTKEELNMYREAQKIAWEITAFLNMQRRRNG